MNPRKGKALPGPDDLDLGAAMRRRYGSDRPADQQADEPADPPADASADAPTGPPADGPTGAPTDAPADAPADTRADAPARAHARKATTRTPPQAAQTATRARTPRVPTQRTRETPSSAQEAVQPRRELEVAGRSYRAGLDRLKPRTDRLTAAVAAMLARGAAPSEVVGSLAEVGLQERDLPADVADQLAEE